jgi:DNA-binding MarR family transcriptional regulator
MSSRKNDHHAPRIGGLLRLAWQHVREDIYTGVCDEGYTDLNPAHVALFHYEGMEGCRPSQLAEQMQITKQSINDLLRHLEKHRYIRLEPDPDDSRARQVRLTRRGYQFEATVRRHAQAAEQHIVEALGKDRFKEFREALFRIAALVKDRESGVASEIITRRDNRPHTSK